MSTGKKPTTIFLNRKAKFEYELMDRFEAGIELTGSEVKSLRAKQIFCTDAFASVEKNQVWLYNVNIAEYPQANQFNHEPARKRRLLMHRYEIERLRGKIKEQGLTLVPITFYWKNNKVKVELGLGKGKKDVDKRHALKAKDAKREMRDAKG
jgi:SsrA-binding protein